MRGPKPGRFLELLDMAAQANHEDCAVWPHAVNTQGYPHLSFQGKQCMGHRVVAMLYHGTGQVAMHSCNNKRCVNPHHLRMGTQQENIQAAWRDGLTTVDKIQAGIAHGRAARAVNKEAIDTYLQRLYSSQP